MIAKAIALSGSLLALMLPQAARAQAPAQPPAPPLTEILEVTVANVDVVVTDAAGKRVQGLKREDFELLENGVPQPITNFSAISETAAPPGTQATPAPAAPLAAGEAPPRRVVVFIDVITTDMFQRKRVVAAISPFLDNLGPSDETMVVSWNGALKIDVQPTTDAGAVREGLARLVKQASVSKMARMGLTDGESGARRRQAIRMRINDQQRSVVALRALLARLTPIEGRKILILISEGFEAQPGLELTTPEEATASPPTLEDLSEVVSSEGHLMIDSVAEAANAAGVTLYTIHGGGLSAVGAVELTSPRQGTIVQNQIANSVAGLTQLAEESGGLVAANSNDFGAALREIAADLSTYYSLGYRVTRTEGGSERRIEVRLRERSLTARTRRAITIRSPEAQIAEALVASLSFPLVSNDLGVSAAAPGVERAARRRLTIPIDVRIPLETLSFVQDGESFVANVSIYIGAADAEKNATEVRRFDQPLNIAAADFGKIGGSNYIYRCTVDLRSRSVENRIVVAVMDQLSKMTGFAAIDIDKDDVANR